MEDGDLNVIQPHKWEVTENTETDSSPRHMVIE